MASLTDVFVPVRPDTKRFGPDLRRGLGRVDAGPGGEQVGKKFGGGFSKAFSRTLKIVGGLFIGKKIFDFFKGATLDAEKAASSIAITNKILEQTGNTANIGSKGVDRLTKSLSLKTGVDKTIVRDGSNILLTFKNIRNEAGKGNDVFNQANQLALDMSATFKTDLKSSATQLGKALDNPIKGVTALQRVGVTFTEKEREKIKVLQESGDTLGAQQIILKALEGQVGGTAEASADSSAKIANAFRQVKEGIGAALLPILDKVAKFVVEKGLPALSKFGAHVRENILPTLKDLGKFLLDNVLPVLVDFAKFLKDHIIPRLVDLGKWIGRNKDFFIPFVAALIAGVAVFKTIVAVTKAWTIAQGILNVVLAANPIGLVIITLAALAAGIVVAWKRSETFRNIVTGAFETVQKVVKAVWTWFRDTWSKVYDFLANPVKDAVSLIIENWNRIRGTARSLWEGLKTIWRRGVAFVVDVFLGLVDKILTGAAKAFGWIPGLGGKLKKASGDFKDFRKKVNDELTGIKDEVIKINVQTQATGPSSILAAFRGGGSGGGRGGGGPFAGIPARDRAAMGGDLDIKALGLNEKAVASLATDFASRAKAALAKTFTSAVGSPVGRFFFPLPRGRYRVGVPFHGYPGHSGQDFPAVTGTPVYSPFTGLFSALNAGNRSYGRYANVVAGAWRFIGAHLSGFARGSGLARAGELLGFVGSTGNSTGPHLHAEFRRNGIAINPRQVISYDLGNFMPPGLSLAYNGTGRPERLVPSPPPREPVPPPVFNIYGTSEETIARIEARMTYDRIARSRP